MIQGNWVRGPHLGSLFFLLSSFLFCSSSTMSPSIPRDVIKGIHPLCHDPFRCFRSFHLSFLFVSFLGVDGRRPRMEGIR